MRRPPVPTPYPTLFPYTTLFRSQEVKPTGKLTVEGQPNVTATWTSVYRYRGATIQDRYGATVAAITNDYNVGPPVASLAPTNA